MLLFNSLGLALMNLFYKKASPKNIAPNATPSGWLYLYITLKIKNNYTHTFNEKVYFIYMYKNTSMVWIMVVKPTF